ncbi:DUF559 domain-containing protein [Aeromicrobium sp. Root236]|uniref:DUF559 domain-containing protein n=1 Tax=Aeromicrobium sp. Root236 TaxID=1736498 RepID=UPI00350EDE29
MLVEYDGWQHERDAWQRQRDHLRREALEAAGWLVIVVTSADMRAPKSVAARVARALTSRGYPNGSAEIWRTVHHAEHRAGATRSKSRGGG